jgi:hypothetical protein
MRRVCASFCLFWVSLFSAGARAEWRPMLREGIEVSYRGKYAAHPFFQKMMAELPALRRRAVSLVNETLGVRYRDDHSIILRLADATDTTDVSRENDMRKHGRPNLKSRGRTGSYTLAGRKVVAITFYIEHFIGGTADYRTTIIHEFSHGIMRKLIPNEKVRAGIPGWFKEGLATHLAGQLAGRLRIKLASSKKVDPAGTLQGLEVLAAEKKPKGDSYYEYALHTSYIARAPRTRGLRDFYARIANGVPFRRALRETTGLSFQRFVRRSDARARTRLTKLAQDHGWDAWRGARRAAKKGDDAPLAEFLGHQPQSIFAGAAKLELARLWLRQKRNARRAARLLEEVRDHHMRDVTAARDTKLFLARALLRSGRPADARTALAEYLRDMVSAKPAQLAKARSLLALAERRLSATKEEPAERPDDAPLGDPDADKGQPDEAPAHD